MAYLLFLQEQEYAQLLSTAHRVLDGVELIGLSDSGRKKKFWTLGDSRDYTLYKATHIHHPSAVWARQSTMNYYWLLSNKKVNNYDLYLLRVLLI